jgi:membrane fusion protein, multidrug efflux system
MNDTSTQVTENKLALPALRPAASWWRRPGLWLLLVCLIGAAIYLLNRAPAPDQQSSKGGANRPSGVLPIGAVSAKTGDISVFVSGLGTVTAQNMVTVHSRVDGQLMKVTFREGQFVKAGDLLAEIDPRPFEVQLTQAQGQMARDQALLKNAQLDVARYRTLLAQDSIAKQQLDTQEALVRQYEGTVKVDQGQIDNARLQLTYARVTAPIGGRLGLRQVDPGNIVHASDTNGLVVIAQLQPVTVVFALPEDSLPAIMKKLRADDKPAVDAFNRDESAKLATGTLLTVDNQIDASTGTVKLKAQFANDDTSLFPNQFVNVRMQIDVKLGATVIPTAAVQRGTQGTFVYVVKADNTVTIRAIKLGPSQGESVAVDSGLAPGEQVVVDGTDKLREGAKVQVTARTTAASSVPGGTGAAAARGNGARKGESAPAGAAQPSAPAAKGGQRSNQGVSKSGQ